MTSTSCISSSKIFHHEKFAIFKGIHQGQPFQFRRNPWKLFSREICLNLFSRNIFILLSAFDNLFLVFTWHLSNHYVTSKSSWRRNFTAAFLNCTILNCSLYWTRSTFLFSRASLFFRSRLHHTAMHENASKWARSKKLRRSEKK